MPPAADTPIVAAQPDPAEHPNPAHIDTGRKLALNFFLLVAGEMTAKLLTFASLTYLARTLGPTDYGFIEFTLAVMVFFTLPADLGLGSYGVREIAHNPSNAARLLHAVTGLRMALALCSMALLAVFILLLNKGTEVKLLIALYGVSLLGGPFLLQWFFQAHDQMRWVGIASIIRQAGFAALVFIFCRRQSSLVYVGAIECGSVACVAFYCAWVTRSMGYGWPWPDMRLRHLAGHLAQALPIGLAEIAWAFMWYFCTVLLGVVLSGIALGWFGAAHRIVMALHTFVYLYFFNLLPSISRTVGRPAGQLLDLMNGSIRLIGWTGLFGAALLTALAPQVFVILYGPGFRGAAASFSVLVWMLPIAMLSGHYRYTLIAYRLQNTLLRCAVISAVVAVALGFALVPLYAGVGAAWALLIANAINFVLVRNAVSKLVAAVPLGANLAAPLGALLISGVVYAALAGRSIPLALSGAITVYLAALLWFDGRRLFSFARRLAPAMRGI
jgi:O-antigen/teichoic acid export membrane protein